MVALFAQHHVSHSAAHNWLTHSAVFATTPFTEAGLLRVMMTQTAVSNPLSGPEALARLRELRALPNAVFWPDHTSLADRQAVTRHLLGPKQVTDIHLLNLALANGGQLVTFDKGIVAPLDAKARKSVQVLQ